MNGTLNTIMWTMSGVVDDESEQEDTLSESEDEAQRLAQDSGVESHSHQQPKS